MPLKILLADDSMTAQKMGKDILTGGGYEVIAVSNGAAAAKKLAEKPDICVLDILMPGYSGIEVCEKIRAAIGTARMPVLLTVGKMEHYEQKDVQRVAADGVIVKPFEASDLLAAVQKLAERISAPVQAAAATSGQTRMAENSVPAIETFKVDSRFPWNSEAEESTGEEPASKKSMDMPAEYASAPAFFQTESTSEAAPPSADIPSLSRPPHFTMAAAPFPSTEKTAPSPSSFKGAGSSAFDLSPTSSVSEIGRIANFETPRPERISTGTAHVPTTPAATDDHAIEFTAHAPVDVNPPIISDFEATAQQAIEVPQVQDPALVTGPEGFDSFQTKIGVDAITDEDDFEARVAEAMTGFEEAGVTSEPEAVREEALQTAPAPEPTAPTRAVESWSPVPEAIDEVPPVPESGDDPHAVPEGMLNAALVEQMQAAIASLPVEVPAVPARPPSPAVVNEPEPKSAAEIQHEDMRLAKAMAAAVSADGQSMAGDATLIIRTVHKVFERMLPDIMDEVKKELESGKK